MRLLIFLFFISCAGMNKTKLSGEIGQAVQKVCLSSEGNGRLTVLNKKYVYSYESVLEADLGRWILAMSFPLRNPETFELDWSEAGKVKFTSSIEERILKENKNINPKSLEDFTNKLGHLFDVIVRLQLKQSVDNSKFDWSVSDKDLVFVHSDKKLSATFTNLTSNNSFGLVSVTYSDLMSQDYKLDLVVSNCLK